MIDYKTLGKNIYICNIGNDFFAKDYNNNILTKINVFESDNCISFSLENEKTEFIREIINLFSEILYFKGNKRKDVMYNGAIDLRKIGLGLNIKNVEFFEKEREHKFKSIDELYRYPHLVPWNLVPREWDVIKLVNKYSTKDKKILEIGSGYGKNLDLLNNNGYLFTEGLEYSKNAYELSKKIINNNKYGDITKSGLKSEFYDLVIDIGCLHCIDSDKVLALSEVNRILKQNGLIISRYFLPKDKEWLKKYPIKVDGFGSTKEEVFNLFSKYFDTLECFTNNGCVYYVGRKRK